MGVSVAFVPFRRQQPVDAKAVAADVAGKWPDLPPPSAEESDDGHVLLEMGDVSVIAAMMPAPIPWGDLEGPCETSLLWSDAAEQLRDHESHLIVTVIGTEDPVERAKALTVGIAGILGACPEALGVYWGDATLVVPSPLFQDMATEILPDGLPLYLWVDFRAGRNEDGATSGFTVGLAALGHMEFETHNASDDVGTLRERFYNLADYVLANGPVIKDGNTVGADENEKIRVVYSKSKFGLEGKVMRLDYLRKPKNRK